VCKADLPISCAVVTKSGNVNFLEPSGPLQACDGTALPSLSMCYVMYSHGNRVFVFTRFVKKKDGFSVIGSLVFMFSSLHTGY